MVKKCITDYDLNNKRVIIRVDFNVPVKDGIILDDSRIRASLKTIKYAIDNNAKVILLSHMGRIKGPEDLAKNDLSIVALRLSELLFRPVKFINKTRGYEVEKACRELNAQEVLLIQNTRYEDLDGQKESKNDKELAAYWASLGDIFVNDAFATCHRAHASNVGIASLLPSAVGFLVQKEVKMMDIIDNPTRPFTIILGGAKVKDKIGLIDNLITKADYILIGGGMAYTFLKALNNNIGNSIVDDDSIDYVKKLIRDNKNKIILPIDTLVSKTIDGNAPVQNKDFNDVECDDIGVDIGNATIGLFKEYIKKSETVIMNGPMGIFEVPVFSMGTKEILSALTGVKTVILGGGDTASAAFNLGFKDNFTHISTGGGASLEMFAGNVLPAIDVIDE